MNRMSSGYARDVKPGDDEEVSRALLNMVSWLGADWENLGPHLEVWVFNIKLEFLTIFEYFF